MLLRLKDVCLDVDYHPASALNQTCVLLSHPHPLYGGNKKNKIIDQLYLKSIALGFSVLRYNMRGVRPSEGCFDKGVGETQDLMGLVQWLVDQGHPSNQIILMGYSFGSWISARVSQTLHLPVMMIAPPFSVLSFPILSHDQSKFLVLAGRDEFSTAEKNQLYFDSMNNPKQQIQLKDSDHFFIGSTMKLIESILKEIKSWGS